MLAAAITLSGCASGYSTFYKPSQDSASVLARRANSAPATPAIERIAPPSNSDDVVTAYARRGYQIIGVSSFNSGRGESENAAVAQGAKVGADIVLVINPQYTGTVTSAVPIVTPTTTTSYTTGSATAYGAGTPVTAYGSSTTTTYGTRTNYVPISTNRYDFTAVYFVQTKARLGAFVRDLTDNERQSLGTNQGVVVTLIANQTPAFYADILPGDVFLSMNGGRVSTSETYGSLLEKFAGKNVELVILRNGERLTKSVHLNQ